MLLERRPEILAIDQKESEEYADSFSGVAHLHAYQPPRQLIFNGKEIFNITGQEKGKIGYNERIWRESYKPIIESIAESPMVSFDFYGVLRDWVKVNHPEDWSRLQFLVKGKSRDSVLGDPYLHPIFPLIPQSDRELLISIGKDAFYDDFGFYPKGLWLPESAVNLETLEDLKSSGIEFVLLRNDQLNLDKRISSALVKTNQGDIKVYIYNSDVSSRVAFGDIGNADTFACDMKGRVFSRFAVDWETFGHHRGEGSLKFMDYLVNKSSVAKSVNSAVSESSHVKINPNSSWSCDHNLGRWTGDCCCDNASYQARNNKRELYRGLTNANEVVNKKLRKGLPNWKETFEDWFLDQRQNLASGKSVETSQIGRKYEKVFEAKFLYLVGMTSCSWFFGNDHAIERSIAENSLREIKEIFFSTNIFSDYS